MKSQSKRITIKDWLKQSDIKTLDAQLLLSFVLNKSKEWILAHDDYVFKKTELKKLEKLKQRRQNDEPLAYIVGKKEFYRRDFIVTPDVLIPRPETEQVIDAVLYISQCDNLRVLDVGTGSGCIGITLKLERPELDVTVSDISQSALKIAKKNWKSHKEEDQKIKFVQSDLLEEIKGNFDIIVANLPYVSPTWQVSPETKHEPKLALFAGDDGLSLVQELLLKAQNNLASNGFVVLETDDRQHKSVINFAKNHSYKHVETRGLVLLFQLSQ